MSKESGTSGSSQGAASSSERPPRLQVPEIDDVSLAFGDIKHMPNYEAIPDEFKKWRGNVYVDAVSSWFFKGAKSTPNGIIIDGKTFTAKPGVDAVKALRAIKAVLGSWAPKHEHKEAACAFMLSEWFDVAPAEQRGAS